MRITPRWLLAVSLLVALGAPGCARGGTMTGSIAGGDVAPARGSATLTIENNNFAEMDVFVMPEGGDPVRLGMATGLSTTSFTVDPLYMTGNRVRIIARPIGGRGAARSGPLTVLGGQTITFMIQPELDQSFASVR